MCDECGKPRFKRRKGQEEFIPIFLGVIILLVVFLGTQFMLGAQKRVVETVAVSAAADIVDTDLYSMLNYNRDVRRPILSSCNNEHRLPLGTLIGLALAQGKEREVVVDYAGKEVKVDVMTCVEFAYNDMTKAGLQFGDRRLEAEFNVEYTQGVWFKQGAVEEPIVTLRAAIPVPDSANRIAVANLKLK